MNAPESDSEPSETARKLPDLNEAMLDPSTVDQLFADLAACTEVSEIQIKTGARDMVPHDAGRRPSLEDTRSLVRTGAIRAAQIRYRYEGRSWCDTLMVLPQGVRLVRMEMPADPG